MGWWLGGGGEGASGNRGTFINVTFSVQAYTSISSTKSAYMYFELFCCCFVFVIIITVTLICDQERARALTLENQN